MKPRERAMQWNRLAMLGRYSATASAVTREAHSAGDLDMRREFAAHARRWRQDAQTQLRVIAMQFGYDAAVELRQAFREGVTHD